METNEKLRQFLNERGFKQSAVAKGIGVNHKTFNAMLNGHAPLKVETLVKVCDFCNVKPEIFFKNRVPKNEIATA